jgi:hypothetical protein
MINSISSIAGAPAKTKRFLLVENKNGTANVTYWTNPSSITKLTSPIPFASTAGGLTVHFIKNKFLITSFLEAAVLFSQDGINLGKVSLPSSQRWCDIAFNPTNDYAVMISGFNSGTTTFCYSNINNFQTWV